MSLLATSIGATRRFELLGIAAIVGAVGKVARKTDDIGAGVVAISELGMFVAKVGVLAIGVELFTDSVGALLFFPKL